MATIYGSAVPNSGYNAGAQPWVIVTHTRAATSATVRYRVGSNPLTAYPASGTFSGTLKVNKSNYAVSGRVSGTTTIRDFTVTYNQATAFSLAISLTGGIPGTNGWVSTSLSGSYSVPAGTAAPGAPGNLRITTHAPTSMDVVLDWDAVSGATSYQTQYQRDGSNWGNTTTGTRNGTKYTVSLTNTDAYYRYRVYASNAGGNSGYSNISELYTPPKNPTAPTIASGGKVSWTNTGKYTHGVDLQKTINGGSTVTNVALGDVSTWTDTAASGAAQYRVRTWAGTGLSRGESAWSDWSESSMMANYAPPKITAIKAVRCDSAGNLTELGKYVRVTTSGTVSSVLDGTTQMNKVTRKLAYRKKGTTTWTNEANLVLNGAPNNWTNVSVVVGANTLAETSAWEFRYTVTDEFSPVVQAITEVPVSQVALSIGPVGIGAGKAHQQGALDVGGDAYFEGDVHVDGHLELADPNTIVINGVSYPKTGTTAFTTDTLAATGNVFYAYVPLGAPLAPEGWEYVPVSLSSRAGNSTWLARFRPTQKDVALYASSSASRGGFLHWQLVKASI